MEKNINYFNKNNSNSSISLISIFSSLKYTADKNGLSFLNNSYNIKVKVK